MGSYLILRIPKMSVRLFNYDEAVYSNKKFLFQVAGVVGRAECLSALFFLLTFLAYKRSKSIHREDDRICGYPQRASECPRNRSISSCSRVILVSDLYFL